jgi:alpha-mannosidase
LEKSAKNLQKWEGELYLELHNGTYTSVAEIKNYCRRMEIRLRDLEMLSVIASLADRENGHRYKLEQINDMWHTFLIDQFHDVLPGTCIGLTYEDTRQNFEELSAKSETLLTEAVESLLGHYLDGYTLTSLRQVRPHFDDLSMGQNQVALLLNTLSCDRFERLRVNYEGQKVEGQVMIGKLGGMALVDRKHLEHSMSVAKVDFKEEGDNFLVENRSYKIVINKDGSIHSWKDKRTKNFEREICRSGDRINKLSIH